MADIPGTIEGAKDGIGLGHQFLRHVERCRLLVHIVDISGSEGRDPKNDFQIINNEIKVFNPELALRPMLVVGNKCDLATDAQISEFKAFVNNLGLEFFPIMAPINYGTDKLLDAIEEKLAKLPPIKVFEAEETVDNLEVKEKDRTFTITKENGVYRIEGKWLLKLLDSINFDDYDSLQYFQKVLSSSGINDALIKKGIKDGDTVNIYDFEFDFIE